MLTYDEQGGVLGIVKSVRHFSHRIIEEFMILANEVVARHLEDSGNSFALSRSRGSGSGKGRRILRNIVAGFGLRFHPKRATPAEFQKFISSIAGRPEERMLSYLMLRSFKQAIYSADNIGHFGLASDAYTHFTSPIRRYPDLVVHRILKAAIARRKSSMQPGTARSHCVGIERTRTHRRPGGTGTDRVEENDSDGAASRREFDAIIIAVWKDGFTVELIDQFIEGFVSVVGSSGRSVSI